MNHKLIELIKHGLKPDLLKKEYKNGPLINPELYNDLSLYGHCYVASECYYHLSGDKDILKPQLIKVNGMNHWYLKSDQGEIIDITAEQFRDPIDYSKGKGKGFLTKKRSCRAYMLGLAILSKVEFTDYSYTGRLCFAGIHKWYKNGLLHREDGPAYISIHSGTLQIIYVEYYLNGKMVDKEEVFDQLSDEQKEKVIWNLDEWK